MKNALTFAVPLHSDGATNIAIKTKSSMKELFTPDSRQGSPSNGVREVKNHFYQIIDADFSDFWTNRIYLSSLRLGDKILDAVIEQVLGNHAELMVDTARVLDEVGRFDVKYGCSPIFYLHRLGLLKNASVAGGIYLDKDDVDLMVQENAKLILTPSFDAGYGHGIPPIRMYLDRGLDIALGTMDNLFNKSGSVRYEAEVLRFLVNGTMCGVILQEDDIEALCG